MKYIKFILVLAIPFIFGFSSCSSNDFLSGGGEADAVPASLRVFLSIDSRSSSPGEDFENGVGYENFIDIYNDDYRIYFFDSEKNTFIDTFKPVLHPALNPDNPGENGSLMFEGYLFPEIGNKFKMVVLANWPAYPIVADDASSGSNSFSLVKGKSTIEDLTTHSSSQFDALSTPENGYSWLGGGRLMPFYGVRSYDLTATHQSLLDNEGNVLPGKVIDLSADPIFLIRAMAKVEVYLDNPYASFESVEMSRINKKGFAAPYKDNASDIWAFDYSDYYSESGGWTGNYCRKGVHLVSGSEVSTLSFTKVNDRKVNDLGSVTPEKWVAYIPEYRNRDTDPASVVVKLKESSVIGSGNEDRLRSEFYFTSKGEAPPVGTYASDIERNNIYRFNIGIDGAVVDIQPFSEQIVKFEFGLMRDARGDLMILPDKYGNYPEYFNAFVKNNHPLPTEIDENGNVMEGGSKIKLEDGDYYAIVVGENESMSQAEIWVKDRTGCRVLTNYSSDADTECSARLVRSFFGNNQSEVFYKDIFGFRRIHHFVNHNSIVIHPVDNNLLFRIIKNFGESNHKEHYYEVESWDDISHTGWVINKDDEGNELGFQKITDDGLLGEKVGLDGKPQETNE